MASRLPYCFLVTLTCVVSSVVAATTPVTPTHKRPWEREFYAGDSQLGSSQIGQWPPSYCRLTNVFFQTARKTFYAGFAGLDVLDRCHRLRDVWTFELKHNETTNSNNAVNIVDFRCDQVFQTGHVFTLEHMQDKDKGFHLLHDTFLPLFAVLHYGRKPAERPAKNVVLIPSVEKGRGLGTDWTTDAFLDDTNYWMEVLEVVAGPYRILPMDRRLAAMQKTMCFKETMFGTPKINFTNPEFIQSFVKFVKNHLNIPYHSTPETSKPLVGLYISGRQKIRNEEEIIKALEPFGEVNVVNYEGLPFKAQVERVQRYTVLAGINGAGLAHALYLPASSVVVQLLPDDSTANLAEYAQVLKSRGPYLEWPNAYSNLSVPTIDDCCNITIELNEFKDAMEKALSLAKSSSSDVLK